jgi:hypothetical protein
MTPPQTSRRRGAAPKRVRDPDEIERQARLFGADWRPGDHVMPWISRHEGDNGELSRLVAEGWSWADVGRAMHLAGITYRTGTPMSALMLRCKAYRARQQGQARQAASRGPMHSSPPGAPFASVTSGPLSEPRPSSVIVASDVVAGATDATAAPGADDVAWHVPSRPTFRPVRFRTPPAPSTPVPDIASDTARVQTPVPAPPGPIDADTAIARMFGRAEEGLSG